MLLGFHFATVLRGLLVDSLRRMVPCHAPADKRPAIADLEN